MAGPIVHVIPVRAYPMVFRRRTVWCGITLILARVAIFDVSTAITNPSTARTCTSTCEGFTKTCLSSSRNYSRNGRDTRDDVERIFFYKRKSFMNAYYFCFNPKISDMYVQAFQKKYTSYFVVYLKFFPIGLNIFGSLIYNYSLNKIYYYIYMRLFISGSVIIKLINSKIILSL